MGDAGAVAGGAGPRVVLSGPALLQAHACLPVIPSFCFLQLPAQPSSNWLLPGWGAGRAAAVAVSLRAEGQWWHVSGTREPSVEVVTMCSWLQLFRVPCPLC